MLCCPCPHVAAKVAVAVVRAGLHVQGYIVCCCELAQKSCQKDIPALSKLPLEDLQTSEDQPVLPLAELCIMPK